MRVEEANQTLKGISREVNKGGKSFFDYLDSTLTPEERAEEEALLLEEHKRGKIILPSLEGEELLFDSEREANKAEDLVRALASSPDLLLNLHYQKALDTLLKIRALEGRLTPQFFRISLRRDSRPDEDIVKKSINKTSELKRKEEPERNICAEDAQRMLEDIASERGLIGEGDIGRVIISDTARVTKLNIATGALNIVRRNYSEEELERYDVHEIGRRRFGHLLRLFNGIRQPYDIFRSGTALYEKTEEGSTLVEEEEEDVMNVNVVINYAGRAIAVDEMVKFLYNGLKRQQNFSQLLKEGFSHVFDVLKKYDFTDHDAYTLCFRAFRGGGYAKDHIYMTGWRDVKEYLQKGGDPRYLMVGRVGVEDAKTVETLLRKGVLKEPICGKG